MNSLADPVASLDHAGIARLLAPLSADAPCGPPARYDPVFTEIRLLREEDDPHLPMGQWERPLKRADWPAIERKCMDMLAGRSKDLQIAVWLVESWMRQHGVDGLRQGLRMLGSLLRAYWHALHPLIEGEEGAGGGGGEPDLDARLAPLEWLNESLGTSLRVHTVLVSVDADKPTTVTLAEWERMTIREMAPAAASTPPAHKDAPAAPGLTRADVIAGAVHMQAELAWMETAVEDCQAALAAIAEFLRAQLAALAPNLGKLAATLEAARRVLAQLHDRESAPPEEELPVDAVSISVDDAGSSHALPGPGRVGGANWRNRTEAYATLQALADYLAEVEPHSPTPFLLRRAVNWGRMSLPEVIADIIREEGDVNRFFNVLGVRQ
jgi:type VI secretion system protein ImpA